VSELTWCIGYVTKEHQPWRSSTTRMSIVLIGDEVVEVLRPLEIVARTRVMTKRLQVLYDIHAVLRDLQ